MSIYIRSRCCNKVLKSAIKIRGSVICTDCATKFLFMKGLEFIQIQVGPQVRHARSAAHCLKSVKRLWREKDKN